MPEKNLPNIEPSCECQDPLLINWYKIQLFGWWIITDTPIITSDVKNPRSDSGTHVEITVDIDGDRPPCSAPIVVRNIMSPAAPIFATTHGIASVNTAVDI